MFCTMIRYLVYELQKRTGKSASIQNVFLMYRKICRFTQKTPRTRNTVLSLHCTISLK